VLITGASRGIGLACAEQCIARDVHVTGVARSFSQLEQKVERTFEQISCDLGDVAQLAKALASFPESVGALVLNAGYGQFGGLEQFSHQQIQRLIDTNLVSNLVLLKHYLPLMKRQGGGDIVLIGSESGLQGAKAGAVYCASKFAIRGLAQSLRADCSTSNIRVHLINPGPVDTGFFDELNFTPQDGQEFVLNPVDVATVVMQALEQPRHVVSDEINLQPMKRSFRKR